MKPFTDAELQFTDTEFMTATAKRMVLKQWRTFLKALATVNYSALRGADYGSYPMALETVFTDRLYKHLSNHCGFIAHFNRRGFLSARFGTPSDTADTLLQMERGFVGSGYRDIHQAMLAELETNLGLRVKSRV